VDKDVYIITFVTNVMICNKFYDDVIVLAVCSSLGLLSDDHLCLLWSFF